MVPVLVKKSSIHAVVLCLLVNNGPSIVDIDCCIRVIPQHRNGLMCYLILKGKSVTLGFEEEILD